MEPFATTLLHTAAKAGSLNVIDIILLIRGIDINKLESRSLGGYSALHCACMTNRADIAEKLIAAGTDINIASNSSQLETPLHVCCKHNSIECCALLLAKGVQADKRDGFGHSASFWAHIKGFDRLLALPGLPKPSAATPKEHLDLLSQRVGLPVIISKDKSKKKGKGTGKGKGKGKKKK
jgi:ankyrin repeat protein